MRNDSGSVINGPLVTERNRLYVNRTVGILASDDERA